jgi:hypothetical protein
MRNELSEGAKKINEKYDSLIKEQNLLILDFRKHFSTLSIASAAGLIALLRYLDAASDIVVLPILCFGLSK